MANIVTVGEFFRDGGPLARKFPNYQARRSQVLMAQTIYDACVDSSHLAVEAPTGSGKSMAYLVGGLLSGRSVVVTTANHNLQKQLMQKDLPILREVFADMGMPFTFSLLMGKSNYFCRLRAGEPQLLKPLAEELYNWGMESGWESYAGLSYEFEQSVRPLDKGEWSEVNADDTCGKWSCPMASQCGYMKSIKQSRDSDVVVGNHHMLAIEVAGGILGGIVTPADFGDKGNLLVIDEAHTWSEILANSSSLTIHKGRFRPYEDEPWYSDVYAYFDRLYRLWTGRNAYDPSKQLVVDWEIDSVNLQQNLTKWAREVWKGSTPTTPGEYRLRSKAEQARNLASELQVLGSKTQDGFLRLLEQNRLGWALRSKLDVDRVQLRMQMVDVSQLNARYLDRCLADTVSVGSEVDPATFIDVGVVQAIEPARRVVVYTSATLRAAGRFEFFLDSIGYPDMKTLVLPHVFNYRKNSLLYLPTDLPDKVHSEEFLLAAAQEIWELAAITEGRMFVLVTSYSKLTSLAQELERLMLRSTDAREWLILRQDEDVNMPAEFLMRAGHKTILIGTATYWQGIDIPGKPLSQVVILTCPFVPHTDPVFQAKSVIIEERYGAKTSFMKLSIPLMVSTMSQGAGRAVRTETDRAVVTIMDPRILNSRWGMYAIKDLPMPVVKNSNQVRLFFGGDTRIEDLV